jgi:tRNA modification GTPase
VTEGGSRNTIVALSSGPLPAAIAVIRSSGPAALAASAAIAGTPPRPRRASLRTLRDPASGSVIDRGLVVVFPGPNSATGEDIVEYQCHGSRAVVSALLSALTAQPGVRTAEPGEFTRRALGNGRIDLTQAEGLAELLEAESETQRKSALLRAEGALRRQIEHWRQQLLDLSSEAEVAIDYADEEDGGQAFRPAARIEGLIAELDHLLEAPRVERIRDGVRVVVAGPPNAGKSSLVNALAGQERAIVTAMAGTTRDLIEVPLTIGGVALSLVDSAGLRDSDDEVEQIGISLAERAIASADVVLWLGDPSERPDHPRVLQIAAKADKVDGREGHAVSALTGQGVTELKTWIALQSSKIVPVTEQPALTEREADLLQECGASLLRLKTVGDPVIVAEELRLARSALDRISGLSGVEGLLDTLFGRFCLGK